MADEEFRDPRLARLYDVLDHERRDLEPYLAIVADRRARAVVDVGCGTGVLALRLAATGIGVTGVDPAAASLDVARGKPGAGAVTWIEGTLPGVDVQDQDLALMTGNAAQAVVADEDWRDLLRAVRRILRPGGAFVFEVRDPRIRAWEGWAREATTRRTVAPGLGAVVDWTEVLSAEPPLVTFRSTWAFEDGGTLTSTSTLRFRTEPEVRDDLAAAGLVVTAVDGAPDRPGAELVFHAERAR